jgi:hypothetical protein
MPVQDYYNTQKKAIKEVDTLLLRISESYNAAIRTTIDEEDGLVNRASLEDQGNLNRATRSLTDIIENEAKRRVLGNPEATDVLDIRRAWAGYLGLSKEDVIKKFLSNPTPSSFSNDMERSIQRHIKSVYMASALDKLAPEDSQEVVNYTHTMGRVDPAKLSIYDMAELLDEYKKGVITNRFLQRKNYLVDGFEPPDEGPHPTN